MHGQIYHRIGSVVPVANRQATYGQLYIFDSGQASTDRMNHPANRNTCRPTLMNKLSDLLARVNPYAADFRMMKEILDEEETQSIVENRQIRDVLFQFDDSVANLDRRRYNAPTANEIAVVFVGNDGDVPAERSIVIHGRGGIDLFM